ncbi:hypothetical protein ASPCADRAFT_209800 [Aspergillus carbonarius ITEM 5010]|uniref:Uncharacterized protein n=1 Tax=Aspergillus carbonarius (strain ITEM 5010) TaxID=602072 RepID=A0A1R3RFF1_ASPC5|nr:hypothetical protein ASPCADRAFT_209800 [Aspergillus carbonarius ITEM 5010]
MGGMETRARANGLGKFGDQLKWLISLVGANLAAANRVRTPLWICRDSAAEPTAIAKTDTASQPPLMNNPQYWDLASSWLPVPVIHRWTADYH